MSGHLMIKAEDFIKRIEKMALDFILENGLMEMIN